MNRRLKIYLDTSVISALFDRRSPEIMKWTQEFWKMIEKYEVYVSEEVIRMVNSLYNYPLLEIVAPPELLGGEEI